MKKINRSNFLPRLNHVLRTVRWTLEITRLVATAAQTGIDAVTTLTDGRPEKPKEEEPETPNVNQ